MVGAAAEGRVLNGRSQFPVVRSALALLSCGLGVLWPGRVSGQTRTAGVVEFYGVEKVSRDTLLAALSLAPGDTIPSRPEDQAVVAARLKAVTGVRNARLEPVCCEDGKWILFVGVEERGALLLTFGRTPTGSIRVSDTLRTLSEVLFERMMEGVKAGESPSHCGVGAGLGAGQAGCDPGPGSGCPRSLR